MVLRIEDISFIGVYVNDSFRDFKDINDYANYHVSLLNLSLIHIYSLHLEGESRIFCSEEGGGKLKDAGFTNAVSSIDYPLARCV